MEVASAVTQVSRSPTSAATGILDQLRAAGRPRRAELMAAEYMSSNLKHLGCTVPDVRRIAKAQARSIGGVPAAHVLAVAQALVDQRIHDSRLAGYEILGALPQIRDALTVAQLAALGRGNDNWAAVDCFCSTLSGPQYSAGILAPAALERWAVSKDPWTRRAALATVATAFQRAALRGRSQVGPSLAICARLVDDRHDHVVKALSWALRGISSRDRGAVERFLAAYDGRLAARVKREVGVKLATGTKNKRKGR
jgi:3-methyladenine DNA glycosylase AlkD